MSAEHIAGLASVDGGELLDHDLVQALLPRCTFPAPGNALRCGWSGGPDSTALVVMALAAGLVCAGAVLSRLGIRARQA